MKNPVSEFKLNIAQKGTRVTTKKRNLRVVWTPFIAPTIFLMAWMMAIVYSTQAGGLFLYELGISGFIIACLLLFRSLSSVEEHKANKRRNS